MSYGGTHPIPLYGVPIRAVIDSGDPELMKAMLKVSDYLLARMSDGMDDWQAAHKELGSAVK